MSLTKEQVKAELIRLYEVVVEEDEESDADFFYNFMEKSRAATGVKTNLGNATFLEEGVFLDTFSDKVQFFVFKIGKQFFRVTGWSDSWAGGGEWNYEGVHEVVQQAVTRYEYLPIGNGNGNTNRV